MNSRLMTPEFWIEGQIPSQPDMKPSFLIPTAFFAIGSISSAAVVQFDFSVAGGGLLQAGWTDAPLGNGSGGGVTLTTSAITAGAAVTVDSRNRAGSASDAGGGAEANMWNDFVFANGSFSTRPGSGLSLSLVGLSPNTIYPITIWAFDDASNAQADGFARATDWSGGGGSGRLTFPDAPDPATLADYNITFNSTSDAAGALTITGIVSVTNPSTSHNVFINGLEVGNAIPEPSGTLLSLVGLGGLALRRRR